MKNKGTAQYFTINSEIMSFFFNYFINLVLFIAQSEYLVLKIKYSNLCNNL